VSTLTKRRAIAPSGPAHPAHWEVSYSYPAGRQMLEPGRELTITGERGATFRFVRHVKVPATGRLRKAREWIDVVGGTRGVVMDRAFRPDRIGRVLRPKTGDKGNG
jgi:hypothetical protein